MPFRRFPGSDSVLEPEMRSTGEVMGSAKTFGMAYAKSELAAGEDYLLLVLFSYLRMIEINLH